MMILLKTKQNVSLHRLTSSSPCADMEIRDNEATVCAKWRVAVE